MKLGGESGNGDGENFEGKKLRIDLFKHIHVGNYHTIKIKAINKHNFHVKNKFMRIVP